MRPNELPDELRGRAFGPADARRAGIDRNRLRRKDLLSPFHGVRVSTPPTNVLERCLAYLPRMKPGQFFSHSTGAILLGHTVPSALQEDDWVHVAALQPADAPHARHVHGHRLLEASAPWTVHGLPVSHPADVLWQLATMLDLEDLVIVVDELLDRTELPVADAKRALVDRAAAARRIGAARIARAIAAGRRGARSPAETRIRLVLSAAGVPDAELNAPITEAETGRYLGAPDFVWREQKVVLEYEGDGHRVDQAQFRYDIVRYDDLMADGWRVIRATGDDLTNEGRKRIVLRVRRALQEH